MIFIEMEEIWKDVKGYEGLYEVSNFGRVKRLTNYHKSDDVEYLPTYTSGHLLTVHLKKDKKQHSGYLHILVATAFVPNTNNYRYVLHKDGNRNNNHAENLYWSCFQKHVCGIGINDDGNICLENTKKSHVYKAWTGMLSRCYSQCAHHKQPTYVDCYVCDEWLVYSVFKKWFEDPKNGYMEGYQLDKDIICKGNKVYSPDTCCLVPHNINKLFATKHKRNKCTPLGVSLEKSGMYSTKIYEDGKITHLGVYNTAEEAFVVYKMAKEKRIKDVATQYYNSGQITKRVYEAMTRYEVEITD